MVLRRRPLDPESIGSVQLHVSPVLALSANELPNVSFLRAGHL